MRLIGHAGLALDRPCGAPDRSRLERAVTLGLARLEVDVAVSGSGELVLVHDITLPGGRSVERLSLDELRSLVPGLLTLDDAYEHLAGRLPLLLDLKGGVAAPLGTWLSRRRDLDGIAACTDDLPSLLVLRHTAPRVARWRTLPPTGDGRGSGRRRILGAALRAWLPARLGAYCREVAAEAVCVDRWAVTAGLCDEAHRLGVCVDAWTVNVPRIACRMRALGVDLVTTDLVEGLCGDGR